MIYFLKKTIETNQKPDELLSRLTWKIKHSKNILLVKTNSIASDKSRPLIGKINQNGQQFEVTRQRSILLTLLPRVIVTGVLIASAENTTIKLYYRLGLYSFAVSIFIFWQTFILIDDMITMENKELILEGIISLAIFLMTGIFLVFSEIAKTNNKVFEILAIEAN